MAKFDRIGRRWGHVARAAGWGMDSAIEVLADGAEWIALQSRGIFGEQARFLLDYDHASQYLAAASECCRPRRSRQWLRTQQKRLKRGAKQKEIAQLDAHQEAERVAEEEAPVRAARRYLGAG